MNNAPLFHLPGLPSLYSNNFTILATPFHVKHCPACSFFCEQIVPTSQLLVIPGCTSSWRCHWKYVRPLLEKPSWEINNRNVSVELLDTPKCLITGYRHKRLILRAKTSTVLEDCNNTCQNSPSRPSNPSILAKTPNYQNTTNTRSP